MENENPSTLNPLQTKVMAAVRHILRPLIRLLLQHGINYTMLIEELKKLYIKVAEEDFPLEKRAQSDSRITLLTGVHRKDVKRLREADHQEEPAVKAKSLGAQLIARWLGDPLYQDEHGQPLPLARTAADGGGLSFESLMQSVSKDIRARPVLDEWIRQGVVTVDQDGRVHLNMEAFVPEQGMEEKLFFLRQNVRDHLATAVDNLAGQQPAQLERCVYYDGLSESEVKELHAYASEQGMKILKAINKRAMQMQAEPEESRGKPDRRMNFGVYFRTDKNNNDI